MSTISHKLSEFAVSVQYENLPKEVVQQVKRFLLDSVGCAFGGLTTEDAEIMLRYYTEVGGKGESVVWGSGKKLPMENATLLNSLLIRALDYNDIYWEEDPSHPSDIIPAAISPAEQLGKSGKDVIVAIALAYEFEQRLCEFAHPGIRERKWHHATLTAIASPIVAGKILGLSAAQMVNAIGISASHSCTLGAVTAGKLTQMKNTVDPMAVASGVQAARLAMLGYTGPEHVIDGKEGLVDALGPEFDLNILTDGLGDSWRIMRCSMKAYAAEALTHSPITAVLKIVKENSLKPNQIKKVKVKTVARAADILSDPSKYQPTSKETADHSLPYCLAAAIVDGMVTPAQFKPEKLKDPEIWNLLPKIEVIAEPEFEKLFPRLKATEVLVTDTEGNEYSCRVDFPRGDFRDPMSDEELMQKFDSMVLPVLGKEKSQQLVEAINRLETFENIADWVKYLVR